MKKKKLSVHQRMLLISMHKAQRPLSTRKLAERTGMSWLAAKRNLEKLVGTVQIHSKTKRKTSWNLKSRKKKKRNK